MVKEDTTWYASKNEELDIELSQTKKGIDSQENKSKTSSQRNEQTCEEVKIELSQMKKGINSQENESKTSPKRNQQKSEEGLKIKLSHEKNGQESKDKKVQSSQGNDEQDSNYKKGDESPLILATISNIPEIVEEILIHHPESLEHTSKDGRNILQLAILYRHKEIFEMVVNSNVLTSSVLSATDHDGNSLLHMVGQKRKSQASERMQCPAFQLQKELLFFQVRPHLPLTNKHKYCEP